MSRAGHVLGILPPAMAQGGLLQEIKVKYGEADKGWVVNGHICHPKGFILSMMAKVGKILSGNKM